MLGVGMDLPWGRGLLAHPEGDHAAPGLKRLLARHRGDFGHLFVSWQPRSRAVLRLEDYAPAWDDLFQGLEGYPVRALHHTALNLAAPPSEERGRLLDFTNALIERYGLAWVNEDLGFWSLRGRPLPYPLPPVLTDEGLELCLRNAREVDAALAAPLRVEFPGFSEGWSITVGPWDAYDFFAEVIRGSGCECTLDTGHLLSWRWRQGHRGEALLQGLDRLPLEACTEVHLSGVEVNGEEFVDAHHGALVEAQYALLERLRALCPQLSAVTFEDPVFDEQGRLDAANEVSLARLRAACARPIEVEAAPARACQSPPPQQPLSVGGYERDLDRALRGGPRQGALEQVPQQEVDGLAAEIRRRLANRSSLGLPSLRQRFAPVFAKVDEDTLLRGFLASKAYGAWHELPGQAPGIPLEEAFFLFASTLEDVDPRVLRRLRNRALVRALAVDPSPAWTVPTDVLGEPGRWILLGHEQGAATSLHAAVDGRVIEGALPPLAAALVRGESVDLPTEVLEPLTARLQELRIFPKVDLDKPRLSIAP